MPDFREFLNLDMPLFNRPELRSEIERFGPQFKMI